MPADRSDTTIALNLSRIIFRLLTNPQGWRVDELKRTLGIADRTYRKYKSVLALHFDHLWDAEGKTLLVEERNGDARYLRLRDSRGMGDEDDSDPGALEALPGFQARVVALELARQAFAFLAPTGIGQDLGAFQQEFLAQVEDRTYVFRSLLRHLDRRVCYAGDAPKDYGPHEATLRTVITALLDGHRLEVTYRSASRETGPGAVEPLTLLVWRGALYLVARDKGHKEPYYLAINHIVSVRNLREPFHYPSPADYRPESMLEGHFGIFREPDARPRVVELVFANQRWLKMYVQERKWHPTQQFEELPDGRLRMTFTVSSLQEVRIWVRGFGPDVEVVKPSVLKNELERGNAEPSS
jgi:proteasome accessory factor B